MKAILWLVFALWSFERTRTKSCNVIEAIDSCYPSCCDVQPGGILYIFSNTTNGLLKEVSNASIDIGRRVKLEANVTIGGRENDNSLVYQFICTIGSGPCPTRVILNNCSVEGSVVELKCILPNNSDPPMIQFKGRSCCRELTKPTDPTKTEKPNQEGATNQNEGGSIEQNQDESTDNNQDGATDNKAAIASGTVIGSLIIVILAALLAVQLIRMFRKKQHHSTNGKTQPCRNLDTHCKQQISLDNATYLQRLPVEPSPHVFPDECAVMKESYIHGSTLPPQEPSPYEAPSVAIACYAVLGPPDEAEGRGQSGGRQTDPNHYTEQHVYEDADKYTSTTHVANAEYKAAMKHKKRVQFQNTLPQTPDTSQDYAEPDDALFDEKKYETQPKMMKQGRGGGEKDGVGLAKAPISTWCHHPDDEDYSIPDDAIHPQQHSSNGTANKERVTIESTTYETAQAKSGTATASVGKEPQKISTTCSAETSTEEREGEAGSPRL